MRLVLGIVLAVAAMLGAAKAQETYPSRPVKIIVAFPVGGLLDTVSRLVGDKLSAVLGQQFIIESRPGAGGTLATAHVAKSDPDGHTVLLLTSSQASYVVMHTNLPYDPVRDLAPVAMFGIQPSVLVAAPSKGWKTLADLIAAAKARPGALNYASAGLGSASHWPAERLKLAAGIDVQHIPFRGPVEAFTEVMTGRIDFYYLPIVPALPHIRDGKVVALAVSTPTRSPSLPDVPSVVEAGLPDFQATAWNGLFAPNATPKPIIDKLVDALDKALDDPQTRKRLDVLGGDIPDKANRGPAPFLALVKSEIARWSPIIKAANIKMN